ncbi:N-acetylmuramoyl-L-alanine amidase [Bacillus sp. UNC41MFS5]|uniref:N-acetylmuramoyl-L-alanine amidase n=1 Tax=Bacillus sp. UNC41MFS5 TaxID=1449046 RepID=UPI00047B127E|nr:N-acetylmuramoyl-L-alanine amidase [Bacillus sp. UNC41MFS5]
MTLWVTDLIKVNQYTRSGKKLSAVKGIVLHYTATPKASAKNERDYFNGTCIADKRYASAHLFIDKNEARLIIPLNEVAYHAHDHSRCYPDELGDNANLNTIGVEMCIEADGSIHKDTLARTVQVVAELCKMFKLNEKNLYRHYDITGKNCPAMWVSNPSAFTSFKASVANVLKPAPKPSVTPSKPSESIGKVEVLVDSLWYYNKPDWDAKEGMASKGDVFTVVKELTVEGAKMYLLKSGNYITASTKYVKFSK